MEYDIYDVYHWIWLGPTVPFNSSGVVISAVTTPLSNFKVPVTLPDLNAPYSVAPIFNDFKSP